MSLVPCNSLFSCALIQEIGIISFSELLHNNKARNCDKPFATMWQVCAAVSSESNLKTYFIQNIQSLSTRVPKLLPTIQNDIARWNLENPFFIISHRQYLVTSTIKSSRYTRKANQKYHRFIPDKNTKVSWSSFWFSNVHATLADQQLHWLGGARKWPYMQFEW